MNLIDQIAVISITGISLWVLIKRLSGKTKNSACACTDKCKSKKI